MFSHVWRRVNTALHAGSWHALMRLFGITHTVDRFSAVVEALHAAAFGSVVSVADEVYDESACEGVEDECGENPKVFHGCPYCLWGAKTFILAPR